LILEDNVEPVIAKPDSSGIKPKTAERNIKSGAEESSRSFFPEGFKYYDIENLSSGDESAKSMPKDTLQLQ
jgi:hypothetical protein